MNPGQQLHRSLTFWAGLLVITFTCWAWWNSYSHSSVLRWKQSYSISGIGSITIYRIPNAIDPLLFFRTPTNPSSGNAPILSLEAPSLVRWNSKMKRDDSPTRQSIHSTVNLFGKGAWALYLPYAFITLIPLLTWTALLLFRARRRRRAITPALNESAT